MPHSFGLSGGSPSAAQLAIALAVRFSLTKRLMRHPIRLIPREMAGSGFSQLVVDSPDDNQRHIVGLRRTTRVYFCRVHDLCDNLDRVQAGGLPCRRD